MVEQKATFSEEVKAFFNQPELYLKNEFGRNIRRDILQELLDGLTFNTVLDVGCGDGSLSLDFLGKTKHITLLDISPSMLLLAKSRLKGNHKTALEFVEGNFCKEVLPLKKYNLVLCIGVLAHVENLGKALEKLFDLMEKGGQIALQFSDSRNWMTRLQMSVHRKTYALNRLNLQEMIALCEQAGFKVAGKQQFGIFFPGIGRLPDKWVYRLQRAVYQRKWLSRLGSDFILVLRKKDDTI